MSDKRCDMCKQKQGVDSLVILGSRDEYCDHTFWSRDKDAEISRLKDEVRVMEEAIDKVFMMIADKGINPDYHDFIFRKSRSLWPSLWGAIDELSNLRAGRKG